MTDATTDQPDDALPLFVYGTLRSDFPEPCPEREHLKSIADCEGRAMMAARVYDLGPYPALLDALPGRTLMQSPVMGELWMPRPGQTLAAIDAYEACGPGFAEPTEYARVVRPVVTEQGKPGQAWVYVYNWPLPASAAPM